MNDDLKILITGTLNAGKSIGEINTAIRGIEKKIGALKLNVDINPQVLKTLQEFNKSSEKIQENSAKLNKVFREEETVTKNLDGSIDKLSRKYTQTGEIIEKTTKTIDKRKKSIDAETKAINRQNVELDKLGDLQRKVTKNTPGGNVAGTSETYRNGNKNTTLNFDKDNNLTGSKLVENVEKERQATEALNASKQKLRQSLGTLNNEGKVSAENLAKLNRAIDNSSNIQQVKHLEDNLKNLNRIRENEYKIQQARQQADINVRKLGKQYGENNLDNAALDNYLGSMENLSARSPVLKRQMDDLNMSFKNIKQNLDDSSSRTLSFGDQMKIAAERTVIWGTAMTGLYGSLSVLRQAVDTLYLIDEHLISIEKVVNGANMSQLFDKATESAYNFGRTIDQALVSIEEISKLGFSADDAASLADNSLLLATVGELPDADAANYLVAIMRQYKMEVEDTSKIVDSLNELSNRTGATTLDLAQSMSKSSSAAQTAGISFDELAGISSTVVETLKIGGAEAGNFLKTLSTRMLRDTTLADLEQVGVVTRDNNGEILGATKILQGLAGVWDTLGKSERNALAQSLGGVYHINKVTALVENMGNSMTYASYSADSMGSAMTELETFQEGLAYKTNVLKASWQELVMTMADDGGGRSALVTLLEIATSTVQAFNEVTEATDGWNIKLPLLAAGIYGTVKALQLFSIAAKGAKLSLGWIGVAVIGIEALVTSVAGLSKTNAEASKTFTENAKGYSDNADRLEYLISRHDELKPQINSSTQANEEYKNILNEITKIAPGLIESTDKYGSTLTNNKGKVDSYVESLRGMSDEQLKLAETTLSVSLTNAQTQLDKARQEANKLGDEAKEMTDFVAEYNKKYGVTNLTEAGDEYVKRSKDIGLFGKAATQAANEYARYQEILQRDADTLTDYEGVLKKVTEAEGQVEEIKSRKKELDYLNSGYKEVSKTIQEGFGNKLDSSTLSSLNKTQLEGLSEIAKSFKNGKVSADQLAPALQELNLEQETLDKITQQLSGTVVDGAQAMSTYEDSIDGVGDSADNTATLIDKLANASSALTGTTQDEVDALISAVNVYRLLNDAEDLSAQQKDILATATQMLSDTYPHLIQGGEFRIDQMEREAEQEAILLKAGEMLASGQLSNEEQMTLAMVLHSKARFKILQEQVKMFRRVAEEYAAVAEKETDVGESDEAYLQGAKAYKRSQAVNSTLEQEIEDAMPEMDKHMQSLADATNYQGRYYEATDKSSKALDENTDATKENNEETENSVYIADKYQQQLAELNGELDKLNRLKSKYPEHSKKYRDALQAEIALQKEILDLNKSEQKSLSQQIKSGNIQPKGVVTTSDKDSKGVADYYLNNYRVTSRFGSNESFRSSAHGGIDFANGKQGDPVKALKAGKVTQAYYSSSGGNMVVVQQDDGVVTKYMHMQNGLKVKAGDRVSAGTTLGKVGNTGHSTGAHLHIEMAKNGVKIDPEPIIKALSKSESKSSSKSSSNKSSYSGKYATEINKAANRYGVDAELIAAIIQAESGFNKNARSGAGAQGLMQLMPATARSLGVKDPYNAEQNIMGGTKYISQMIKQFGSLEKALAAYNAGPGNVNKYGGIPPFKETQNYVKKVMASYGGGAGGGSNQGDESRTEAERLQAIDDAKLSLIDLDMAEEDILAAIEELNLALVESYLAEYDQKRKDLEDEFATLDRDQAKVPENSKEWMKYQAQREELLRKEAQIQRDAVKWLRKEIANNKELNEAQKSLLTNDLTDRLVELRGMEQELYNVRLEMADRTVDAMKDALEAQKKVALENIDDMISEIDKIAEEADYAETLRERQNERQDLLNEMDKLALDGSDSARKRMSELAEDLKGIDEDLNDMIDENTRNKRKESLQEERERIEQSFDDTINDEDTWNKVRTDIIDGKTSEITKSFTTMLDSIKNATDILGKSAVNSMKKEIDSLNEYLKEIKSSDKSGKYKASAITPPTPALTTSALSTSAINDVVNATLATLNVPAIKTPTVPNNNVTTSSNTVPITIHIGSIGSESEFNNYMTKFEMRLKSLGVV